MVAVQSGLCGLQPSQAFHLEALVVPMKFPTRPRPVVWYGGWLLLAVISVVLLIAMSSVPVTYTSRRSTRKVSRLQKLRVSAVRRMRANCSRRCGLQEGGVFYFIRRGRHAGGEQLGAALDGAACLRLGVDRCRSGRGRFAELLDYVLDRLIEELHVRIDEIGVPCSQNRETLAIGEVLLDPIPQL